MEDEMSSPIIPAPPPPSSPSSSSSKSSSSLEPTSMINEKENYLFGGARHPTTAISTTKGKEVDRMPFRKMSSSSTTSSGSSSSKKKPLQKQKGSSGARRIKCVLIGDSKTGKSALVKSFLQGHTISDYVPTTQDDHLYTTSSVDDPCSGSTVNRENGDGGGDKEKRKKEITLHICDTGGQEEMDRLRPLCYDKAQMVIICFSVMNPNSFANVTMKWLPEVKRHCMVTEDPENPLKLLLVGTQSDLRSNVNMLLKLMDDGQAPISETQALRLASKIGALKYVESSAVTRSNVNRIFNLATTYGEGKAIPKPLTGFEIDTSFQGKFLPNITERKLLFWRRWKTRQNKSSKMKRLVLLPCLF